MIVAIQLLLTLIIQPEVTEEKSPKKPSKRRGEGREGAWQLEQPRGFQSSSSNHTTLLILALLVVLVVHDYKIRSKASDLSSLILYLVRVQ